MMKVHQTIGHDALRIVELHHSNENGASYYGAKCKVGGGRAPYQGAQCIWQGEATQYQA